MLAQGIGQRVTPQDLLIFGPHGPIDNTLRFADECVRHKVLDVVGDLALTGCEVVATSSPIAPAIDCTPSWPDN